MRTISENIQSVHKIPVMDKIPILQVKSPRADKKSCFYELGAEKAATFGAYSEIEETELLKYIRSQKIDE
ncbi:MAG: hypothetical protein IJ661_07745 [Lachnospiraceae bacterium]|nr:hypothetical protein [Lachnospiraceae bacterium]